MIATRKALGCNYEAPTFGAHYPDGTCIDGYMWDLDSCDEPGGGLRSGGDMPCPWCNTAEYIEDDAFGGNARQRRIARRADLQGARVGRSPVDIRTWSSCHCPPGREGWCGMNTHSQPIITLVYDKADDGTWFARLTVSGLPHEQMAYMALDHMQKLFCGQAIEKKDIQ